MNGDKVRSRKACPCSQCRNDTDKAQRRRIKRRYGKRLTQELLRDDG